ncbi:MAG: class I SAM-dependent methyltransferase [bacterium]
MLRCRHVEISKLVVSGILLGKVLYEKAGDEKVVCKELFIGEAVFDRIARFYDYEQGDFVKDIPFYVEYAKKCGGDVLELACGTGRVLIPIAQKSMKIAGLDISKEMLNIARKKLFLVLLRHFQILWYSRIMPTMQSTHMLYIKVYHQSLHLSFSAYAIIQNACSMSIL